jgi:hypothetical protein
VTLLLLSGAALAQIDAGKISGTVKDPNGAIVPGANVTVTNEKTGEERSARTNDDGYFVVPALRASTYRIIGEITGMTGKIDHAELSVGQSLEVTLGMSASGGRGDRKRRERRRDSGQHRLSRDGSQCASA